MTGHYLVRAVEHSGEQPETRLSGLDREQAINKAHAIARASPLAKERGAVSVWVEEDGEILWAAGEKIREADVTHPERRKP